jgi:hypothetical protein
MIAGFALVNRCFDIGSQDCSLFDNGIEHPMITTFHAAVYVTLQISDRIPKNGTMIVRLLGFNSREPILPWAKGFKEVFHQPEVTLFTQDIEHKGIVGIKQRFNRSILSHRYSEPRWIEGGLGYPRCEHGTADIALFGRQHTKRAYNPANCLFCGCGNGA